MEYLLDLAGITKAELARQLGMTANGISKWKKSPPRYAEAYLELLIENRRLKLEARKS